MDAFSPFTSKRSEWKRNENYESLLNGACAKLALLLYTMCGQISSTESSRQPSVMDSGGHLLSNSLWPTKAATLAHQSSCMHDTHVHTDWMMLSLCLLIFHNSHHITVISAKSIHHFFSYLSSHHLLFSSSLFWLHWLRVLFYSGVKSDYIIKWLYVAKIMHYLYIWWPALYCNREFAHPPPFACILTCFFKLAEQGLMFTPASSALDCTCMLPLSVLYKHYTSPVLCSVSWFNHTCTTAESLLCKTAIHWLQVTHPASMDVSPTRTVHPFCFSPRSVWFKCQGQLCK